MRAHSPPRGRSPWPGASGSLATVPACSAASNAVRGRRLTVKSRTFSSAGYSPWPGASGSLATVPACSAASNAVRGRRLTVKSRTFSSAGLLPMARGIGWLERVKPSGSPRNSPTVPPGLLRRGPGERGVSAEPVPNCDRPYVSLSAPQGCFMPKTKPF